MKSNTRFRKNKKGIECLNCKQPISTADNFCSNCGQVNDTKSLSLKQYISELLGGFFSFDTRTINTIIPLLFKPGKVSKAYIQGERMKYVNPFKLYLHTTILFFLISGVFMSMDKYNSLAEKIPTENKRLQDSIKNEVNNEFQINDNHFGSNFPFSKKDSISKPTTIIDVIKKSSKTLSNSKSFLKIVKDTLLTSNKKDSLINAFITKRINKYHKKIKKEKEYKKDSLQVFKKYARQYLTTLKKELSKQNIQYTIKLDSVKKEDTEIVIYSKYKKLQKFLNAKTTNFNKGLDSLGYQKTTYNLFLYQKAQEAKSIFDNEDNKWNFINNMISKSSLVMLFMLPLFTLFLSLVYIRKKYNYTEHLIFVFNVQTVFFILLLIGIIFDRVFDTDLGVNIFLVVFLFYLDKAMRKFYNQGRFKTILKLGFLTFTYFILAIFGLMATAFLAILI